MYGDATMNTTSMPQSRNTALLPEPFRHAKWRMRTSAEIVTEALFTSLKRGAQLRVVGVAGFARPWTQLGLYGAGLAQTIADARATICHELADRQRRYGQRLVVASGA